MAHDGVGAVVEDEQVALFGGDVVTAFAAVTGLGVVVGGLPCAVTEFVGLWPGELALTLFPVG